MKGSSFALLAFVAIAQTTVLANRASLLKADVNSQVQDLSGQGIAGASNAAPPPEVSGDGVPGDSLPPVEDSNSRLNQDLS